MRLSRGRTPGLVDDLQSSHRFTVGVLVAVLTVSVVTFGYLILVTQPHLTNYVDLAREARDAHEGMLDQETGVRGWLATGDKDFLEPYTNGRAATDAANEGLLHDVRRTPDVTDKVVRTLLARQGWQKWADVAAQRSFTEQQRESGELRDFLLQGKVLFDDYRVADQRSTDLIKQRRVQALAQQRNALIAVFACYLVLLAASGAITVRRRRRLNATILEPIDNLHHTIEQLREGHLAARAETTSVPELHEIGSALGSLAAEVDRASREATAREARLASLADRFEIVVRVGREIAGSLSVRYVSATVTSTSSDLLDAEATLWVRDDNRDFRATHRSTDPHGTPPPAHLVPPEAVLRAAEEAVPTSVEGVRGYPLVLAGQVTAVLEADKGDIDEDTEQVLSALLSTAAASLESAHLHSAARELADLDGLTHLPNRRRFEIDVDAEWDRCRRYGRPLSVVMMDLDHFKRLNDEHGHLLGDQVLREVATAVSGVLRTTDTAFRYGGEELVVLLRETGLEDATLAAERIRAAVSALTLAEHRDVSVTTSAGVATRNGRMAHYTDLVAEADRALYDAKRLGRDRVVTAGPSSETLFHGEPDTPGRPATTQTA